MATSKARLTVSPLLSQTPALDIDRLDKPSESEHDRRFMSQTVGIHARTLGKTTVRPYLAYKSTVHPISHNRAYERTRGDRHRHDPHSIVHNSAKHHAD